MELGGNIELFGADECSDNELVVIKKIVGHFAKYFTETYPGFEGLRVTFDVHNAKHVLTASIQLGEEQISSENTHRNLFFALDAALKGVEEKIEG